MAWRIELDPAARRELGKLDPQVSRRILSFLSERIVRLNDPRSIGEALRGPGLRGFWKYRVGDYRIAAAVEDQLPRVPAARIGRRQDVGK